MRNSKKAPEINSSSMADIAFLLLIFFLVTTQFASDKGILIQLPPKLDEKPPELEIPDYQILTVLINSYDNLLVNNDPMKEVTDLTQKVKDHVLNNGVDPTLSTAPDKAIVSIKSDRGTTYEMYLSVLDAVDQAYNELYADKLGITPAEFRELDNSSEEYQKAKEGMPKQVSIAEPTDIGG
ncbi:MAG TPA: hypothetical protein DCE41_25625 [Cytophagales bacterium]|nr:hypothetical protein [Cytophagales bacterium]HAA19919.1 hypothetical protein [Cytophagales bacterium]HAP62653.1 hypothetical protein [Cytophagales bacterium]